MNKQDIEYYCKQCGTVVKVIKEGAGNLFCCGSKMDEVVGDLE